VRLWILALVLVPVLAAACGSAREEAPASATAAPVETVAAEAHAAPTRPRGRPLPAFSGYTLDDQRLSVSDLIGRRLLIYFFNPEVKAAEPMTRAVGAIAPLRGKNNFEILGVATGSSRATALAYSRRFGIDYPVLDDSSAELARQFGLQTPVALLATDAEGYVTFGMAGAMSEDPRAIEANLRKGLRLPEEQLAEGLGRPPAPGFRARRLEGGEPFDFASVKGQPVVLIFFLHTCPHCHASLEFLKRALAELPEDKRPVVLGVEISGRTYAVKQTLENDGLDFFQVLFDDDGSIQNSYGVFAGVPDIVLIDREGRIVARSEGWSEQRHEPLLRMRLAKLVGAPVPMLLRTRGYSGSEACGVCHEMEHETWTFTSHSSAYDTLVRHGNENDSECVSCHVVGYGKPGGFSDAMLTPDLEDVGCESCHGRGGPHLSPDFVARDGGGAYAKVCVTCHDSKHSLGFDFATFRPRISHAENAHLTTLPAEEKARLLAERGRPGGVLLPTNAEYVGSEACRSCHAAEFQTWSNSPHAHAGETLEEKQKAGENDCLRCHTTAFDRPGGFPAGGDRAAHSDLGRVGCESCHGPGGEHVREGAKKLGTIVSLGDKCDSCVILQICGSCHDDANDPGFEFQVQEKIERQRHGTIEAGTGKPKGETAGQLPAHAAAGRAFALRDAGH
jgi:peroxiredoxin